MKKLFFLLSIGLAIAVVGCSEDTNNVQIPKIANFTVTIENVGPVKAFIGSGVFNTPVGDSEPGAATPGKKYEFIINAGRSQHLSFAAMLAATNDLFYGPDDDGISLYDSNGDPVTGDVTDQVYLWDAGTEVNEEPAVGPNTVTNQSGPNMGIVENGNVLKIGNVTNGFKCNYPAVANLIKVTITHMTGTEFKVSIEDLPTAKLVTSQGNKPAPISPGVWVVHGGENPLYKEGTPDLNQGIEAIAEDGNPAILGAFVADNTGITFPASPGVWVVHTNGTKTLFTNEMKDYGKGIEAIAEDGNASVLGGNINALDGIIKGAVFNMPIGSSSPGPLLPGGKYEFSFEAKEGENLSLATMLAATNDVFFGTEDLGIALFDSSNMPISGDITNKIYLWDAGTEVNEAPALGPNTVTNQTAPNTGITESQPIKLLSAVNDGFTYPSVVDILKITITSVSN